MSTTSKSLLVNEKARLTHKPTEDLLKIYFECGQEIGRHDQEPPHERSFSVDTAEVTALAVRQIISERTRAALRMAKTRGVLLGTRNPNRQVKLMVEGIRRQKMEFIAKIRPTIDEIKSTGVATLGGIAECLSRRGIPTRTGKKVWFPSTVKAVLQ